MEIKTRILFFGGWVVLSLVFVALNIVNVDWQTTPIWQGVLLILVLGVIQGSVLELVVVTIATLLVRRNLQPDRRAIWDNLTLVLNYNLLAMAKEDIDEAYQRMYEAYMGNLHPNISAVLVSATNKNDLKKHELDVRDNYRALIYDILHKEGILYIEGNHREIDPFRLKNVWSNFSHLNMSSFARERLPEICESYAKDFMCIHRVGRVLRKCGQYQDLMLLSSGERFAFTYTDTELYGSHARTHNERMFYDSNDVDNIYRRNFNYTLVLDGDTKVAPGTALDLLAIAAANPESSIIQPAITMDVQKDDTIFMHLEKIRQAINEPVTKSMAYLMGQSGFYGKALIKNTSYIAKVIGTRDNLIERVPIDVLSHDTFEAAVLKPYYARSVQLFESPPFNYITWNIRERRWNKGEVLLSLYFWPNIVGKPTRRLQRLFHGDDFVKTSLRTKSKLDFISAYFAHSALRQMFMKPLLLLFILLHINVHMHYPYIPICVMMFLIIIFPKIATCTRSNFKHIIVESLASIFQFTPEAIVGCVRIAKAYQANICKCSNWTPQRTVEEEFKRKNPMVSSLKHLWGYSLLAAIATVVVGIYAPTLYVVYIMLGTVFMLPLFTGLTSYTTKLRQVRVDGLLTYRENLTRSTDSLGSSQETWSWTELVNPTVSLV